MKGIPAVRRLKRGAVLAGVGALVIAGMALGSTHANAAEIILGTDHGAMVLHDGSLTGTAIQNASVNDTVSYSTSEGCPSAESGQATAFVVNPTDATGTDLTQLAPAFGSVAAGWSQNFSNAQATMSDIISDYPQMAGTTTGVRRQVRQRHGHHVRVRDGHVRAGQHGLAPRSPSPTPRRTQPATTTVTVTTSPQDFAGQPITITATVTATPASAARRKAPWNSARAAKPWIAAPRSA